MRQVKISRKVRDSSLGHPYTFILEEFLATFHMFYADSDHEPAAIIEREDGSVETISTFHMTFIYPQSEN